MVPPTTERMGSSYHILLINEEQNSWISPLSPEVAEAAPLVEMCTGESMHQIAHSTDRAGVHHTSSEVRKALPPTLKSGHVLLHFWKWDEVPYCWGGGCALASASVSFGTLIAGRADNCWSQNGWLLLSGMRNGVIKHTTESFPPNSRKVQMGTNDSWEGQWMPAMRHQSTSTEGHHWISPLRLIVQMDKQI